MAPSLPNAPAAIAALPPLNDLFYPFAMDLRRLDLKEVVEVLTLSMADSVPLVVLEPLIICETRMQPLPPS